MKRIEFIKKAGALAGLSMLGVSLDSCKEEEGIDPLPNGQKIDVDLTQSPYTSLNVSNGWLLHPDKNILLVNVGGDIRAFSSVCPHSRCPRSWQYSPGVFTCTCHFSKFDTTGGFLSGPANNNLTEINVVRNGDILTLG